MKTHPFAFILIGSTSLWAGEIGDDLANQVILPATATHPLEGWSFAFGVSSILGAEADFSGLGRRQSPFTAAPTGITADRNYDNGSNLIDDTGNAGGLTSFWSYENPSQFDPSGTGSISLSIFNSNQDALAQADDVGFGIEIFAYKEFGDVPISFIPNAKWGLRFGYGTNSFEFDNNSVLSSSVDVITDSFDLGNATPPAAPFVGSPTGFGNALLGDSPIRSTSTTSAVVSGSREIEATLVQFSAGSYIDFPLSENISVRGEAGLSLALAHGDYSFSSTTTIENLDPQFTQSSESDTTVLPGFYAGLSAVYQINDNTSFDLGIRYQYFDSFSIETGGSQAEIDFSGSFLTSAAISFSY